MLVRARGRAQTLRHPFTRARRARDRASAAMLAVLLGSGLAFVASSAAVAAPTGESPRGVGVASANGAITSSRDEGELSLPTAESPGFAIAGGLVGVTASAILVLAVRRTSPR